MQEKLFFNFKRLFFEKLKNFPESFEIFTGFELAILAFFFQLLRCDFFNDDHTSLTSYINFEWKFSWKKYSNVKQETLKISSAIFGNSSFHVFFSVLDLIKTKKYLVNFYGLFFQIDLKLVFRLLSQFKVDYFQKLKNVLTLL